MMLGWWMGGEEGVDVVDRCIPLWVQGCGRE